MKKLTQLRQGHESLEYIIGLIITWMTEGTSVLSHITYDHTYNLPTYQSGRHSRLLGSLVSSVHNLTVSDTLGKLPLHRARRLTLTKGCSSECSTSQLLKLQVSRV